MATNQYATGKSKLIEPGHGNYPDEWDQPNNANFGSIDALVSGTTTINASAFDTTSKTVTLTFDPYAANNEQPWTGALAGQNLRILINGGLAFDAVLLIPAKVPGFWFIDNQTTGNYTITVKTTSTVSTGIIVKQSTSTIIYCDGTNVSFADSGTIPDVATDTKYGIVTQGLLKTNCVQLDNDAKIPYQTDKYIISTTDPVSTQGSQDWLWFKV